MIEACEVSEPVDLKEDKNGREAELKTVGTREEAIRTVTESIPELKINFKLFSDAEVREIKEYTLS